MDIYPCEFSEQRNDEPNRSDSFLLSVQEWQGRLCGPLRSKSGWKAVSICLAEQLGLLLRKPYDLVREARSSKTFTHQEQNKKSVIAFLEDETSVNDRLLVGVDGVHSHTLDQLVASDHHKPVLSCWVPIFGQMDLPKKICGRLRNSADPRCGTRRPSSIGDA